MSDDHRDCNWDLGPTITWERVPIALLMDIRGELRKINAALGCFRIQKMFDHIRRINEKIPDKRKKWVRRKAKSKQKSKRRS
jgi:hypothetical protein